MNPFENNEVSSTDDITDHIDDGQTAFDEVWEDSSLKDLPGVPGAKFDEVNKRIIDRPYSLASGNKVLAPAFDRKGKPVLADDDPRTKLDQADKAVSGVFKPADHTNFRAAVRSADALDRVSLARRIIDNRTAIEDLRHAFAFIELENLRTHLTALAPPAGLTDAQKTAFGKMCTEVTTPPATGQANWKAMDDWEKANPTQFDALKAHPKWNDIRQAFAEFVFKKKQADQYPQLNEMDLTKNTDLARDVNITKAKIAERSQLIELYLSALSTRIAYLEKLCEQKHVKLFMALPAAHKATNQLKDSAEVKAAVEMMRQLAQCDKDILDRTTPRGQAFLQIARDLGIIGNAAPTVR